MKLIRPSWPFAFAIGVFASVAAQSAVKTYFVDPVGGDDQNNTGLSTQSAFRSIAKAQTVVRSFISGGMTDHVVVNLRGGTYSVYSTIDFTNQDSGRNGYQVIWQAYNHERPILHGGYEFSTWGNTTAYGGAVKVAWNSSTNSALLIPRGTADKIRNFWLDGVRKPWPSGPLVQLDTPIQESEKNGADTRSTSTKWSKSGSIINGLLMPSGGPNYASFINKKNIELTWNMEWRHHRIPVEDIVTAPNGGYAILLKPAPLARALNALPTWYLWPSPRWAFRVENAWEYLSPGTWYHSDQSEVLYYWPAANEVVDGKTGVVPVLNGSFINVKGDTPSSRVTGLVFRGLTFRYSGLRHANEKGVLNVQAGKWLDPAEATSNYNASGILPPGAIQLENAESVKVQNNVFEHLGTAGVVFKTDVFNSEITANIFRDVSESAISLGSWRTESSTAAFSAPHHIVVDNNLIEKAGAEYPSAPAITAYFLQDSAIKHNEIYDAPYSGIALGWGWENSVVTGRRSARNRIENNRVQDYMTTMFDGGGIYLLGNQIDNANRSYVTGNYLANMHERWAAIYPDQGSSWWTLDNNVIEDFPNHWLMIWRADPYISNITASGNWTTGASLRNESSSCSVTNTTVVTDPLQWPPPGAAAIIDLAGIRERNLSRDATASATASSTYASASNSFVADKARDGDISTIWSAAGPAAGVWEYWTLDLGASRRIKKIEVYPRVSPAHPHTCRNLEVWASNDSTFSMSTPHVLGAVNSSSKYFYQGVEHTYSATGGPWVMDVSPDIPYRYIRVRKTVAAEYVTLAEVVVTGW